MILCSTINASGVDLENPIGSFHIHDNCGDTVREQHDYLIHNNIILHISYQTKYYQYQNTVYSTFCAKP